MLNSQIRESENTSLETKNGLERQRKVSPNVNKNDVKKFLTFVAEGEQDKAEAMLQNNPALVLVPGDVADLSKRTFKAITGFQYAVWALDWHMWTMIQKYLPDKAAREQAKGFETGSWVKRHAIHARWLLDNLLKAYDNTFCAGRQSYSYTDDSSQICRAWVEQVGGAQLLLPAHVVNEYCHPTRPFYLKDTLEFPRNRAIYADVSSDLYKSDGLNGQAEKVEWFTASYTKGGLGKEFACIRGEGRNVVAERTIVCTVYIGGWPVLRGQQDELEDGVEDERDVSWDWAQWARKDRNSIHALSSARAAQREELIAKLCAGNAFQVQDVSAPLTSANSLLQSLKMQLKGEKQSAASSHGDTQKNTKISLVTVLVHDLQEAEKEKQALEQTSQELKAQSKRLQEILQKEIAAQKFEYALLEQQQAAFEIQIADLQKSLFQKLGVEQQEAQTHLKALQEQLLIFQERQAILWNEHAVKVQKRETLKRFQSHPNLLLFYRTIHIKLEEIFISFKAVAGGFVNPVEGNVAIVKSIFDTLADAASIAPIVGTAVEKVLKWSVSKGLEKLDGTRQKNTAINASELVTLSEVKKYAESIARQLTERYADQLQRLATAEQEQTEANKLKQGLTKMKEVALKKLYAPPAKQLAIFGVLWIIDQLCDADGIDKSKELDEALFSMISQKTPPNKLKKCWQFITSKLGIQGIHSKNGETWHPEAVYTLPGIRTVDNEYYSAQKLEPQTYGWRLGTSEEAQALGLKKVPAPTTTQAFVIESQKMVQSIREMKQEAEQKTGDIVGGARLKALEEALAKEKKDKEELNQRFERLERLHVRALSPAPNRRPSGILNLSDKKEEQEKTRYVLEELRTFFLEDRGDGDKTENYATYNECLKKVNSNAQLLYKAKQNKHILYMNGKSIEDTDAAVEEISKMIDSLATRSTGQALPTQLRQSDTPQPALGTDSNQLRSAFKRA